MSHSCPVCANGSELIFDINDFDILECRNCGHRFAGIPTAPSHVDNNYGDDYFTDGDAGYPDYLALEKLLRERGRYYAELLSAYMKPASLLDVGCAAGFILKGYEDKGWRGQGLEPNETMVGYARNSLHLDVDQGSLEDFDRSGQFDLVSLIQVIGHFYDLSQSMDRVAALTANNGFCLIEYWDRSSMAARVFGKHWHEYSPPSVLHWFTRKDLDLLLASRGFQYVAGGWPKKYILGSHAKSLLAYKFASLPFKLEKVFAFIPDNLRIRYPSIDLRWALYQKHDRC